VPVPRRSSAPISAQSIDIDRLGSGSFSSEPKAQTYRAILLFVRSLVLSYLAVICDNISQMCSTPCFVSESTVVRFDRLF